jgi:transcriptional regulator GlxA family with amidase domain
MGLDRGPFLWAEQLFDSRFRHMLLLRPLRPMEIVIMNLSDELHDALTLTEFARHARVSEQTLRRLVRNGQGPRVIKISQRIRLITQAAGREWLDS